MKNLKQSIGILGGSFDPPHKGHLKISLVSIKKFKLNKLYWMITQKNPFKNKPFFSLKERLEMCKKMTKKRKKIKIQFLEKYTKSTRTIKMIEYVKKKIKTTEIFLNIGSDNLINFHKWKNWKKIVKLCRLVVFSRKGFDQKAQKATIMKYIQKKQIMYIKDSKIDISSSKIRKIYLK